MSVTWGLKGSRAPAAVIVTKSSRHIPLLSRERFNLKCCYFHWHDVCQQVAIPMLYYMHMVLWICSLTLIGIKLQSNTIQYIPRIMHTAFALLCFVVVIHWLVFPYPSGLLHWHCGNLTIAPVPAKQPWWIWINTSCEFIMNDCITTTKQSTTKPCAYFLGYTVVYVTTCTSGFTLAIKGHSTDARGMHSPFELKRFRMHQRHWNVRVCVIW